jgi:hypothetical protein
MDHLVLNCIEAHPFMAVLATSGYFSSSLLRCYTKSVRLRYEPASEPPHISAPPANTPKYLAVLATSGYRPGGNPGANRWFRMWHV